MAGEDGSAPGITKFNGSNYAYWQMQKQDFLFNKKLHLPFCANSEGMKDDEWNLIDR